MKTTKTNTLKNSSGGGVLKGYYFSIFIVVLLTTTFLALNLVPLLTKTGNSNAESTDVTVEIDPVLSLRLSKDEINLNPNPEPSGTFAYDTLSAIVDTNNKTGYTLTMNSETEEAALIQEDEETKIPSLTANATVTNTNQNNFTMNHWGYSLTSALSDSGTTFNKIPALSTPDTIKTSDAPVLDDTTPVTLATKVDTSLPSGTYKNTLVFSATANFVPGPITPPENTSALTQALADADAEFIKALDGTNYYAMQSMTSDICNAVSTPTKEEINVPEATLIDTRDQELYTVRKLADGNCWMSQNLRLVGPKTLDSTDTDLPTGTFDIPAAQTSINIGGRDPQVVTVQNEYGNGTYYNWYAATANTEMSNSDAIGSICPKGWRLPSFRGTKSYDDLITTYGIANSSAGSMAIQERPLQFVPAGTYISGNDYLSYGDYYGYYWSNKYYGPNGWVYGLYFSSSNVSLVDNLWDTDESSVRCVAR